MNQPWPEAETRADSLVNEAVRTMHICLSTDQRRGLVNTIAMALWRARLEALDEKAAQVSERVR